MGNDGWGSEESQVNQIGTYIAVIPAMLAALLAWGVLGIEVSGTVLAVVVAACGLIGGAINIAGRGPIAAGAVLGLIMALGGFGAVYWWIHGRQSVHMIEVGLAFVVGAAPGFLLQFVVQRMLRQRAAA